MSYHQTRTNPLFISSLNRSHIKHIFPHCVVPFYKCMFKQFIESFNPSPFISLYSIMMMVIISTAHLVFNKLKKSHLLFSELQLVRNQLKQVY